VGREIEVVQKCSCYNEPKEFFSVAFFPEQNGGSARRHIRISVHSDSCCYLYKIIIQTENLYIHSLKHTFFFCSVLGRSEWVLA